MSLKKNTLAIDTSAAYLSLALEANEQVHQFIEKVDNKQSENIIPQISKLLAKAGIAVSELDYIAYNQGPGSFTGLRIGLSVALGIAYGAKALLVPIPSFAIYALQAYKSSGNNKILVGLDARLKELYFAGIDAKSLEYFIAPCLVKPENARIDSGMTLIGSGFSEYASLLNHSVADLPIITADYPSAIYLLELANSGKFMPVSPSEADLSYLRNKVALNLYEQQHKTS